MSEIKKTNFGNWLGLRAPSVQKICKRKQRTETEALTNSAWVAYINIAGITSLQHSMGNSPSSGENTRGASCALAHQTPSYGSQTNHGVSTHITFSLPSSSIHWVHTHRHKTTHIWTDIKPLISGTSGLHPNMNFSPGLPLKTSCGLPTGSKTKHLQYISSLHIAVVPNKRICDLNLSWLAADLLPPLENVHNGQRMVDTHVGSTSKCTN